ncbi:hypothetical protein NQ318_001866, partial [Aromia moschata]
CTGSLESPLLNFSSPDQSNASNLFLGLEWPISFANHNTSSMDSQSTANVVNDGQLNDRINETILIADRITNSLQPNLIEENILLDEDLGDRMDTNLGLISPPHSDIAIDPDLLTLKPTRNRMNDGGQMNKLGVHGIEKFTGDIFPTDSQYNDQK